MALSCRILLVFWYLALCRIGFISARPPTSIGINLGSEYVTAARFSADELPSPLAFRQGNEMYRSYLADCLAHHEERIWRQGIWYVKDENDNEVLAPPEKHDSSKAQRIFHQTLFEIKQAAASAANGPVEIKSITRPRFFNESTDAALIAAFEQHETSYKQPWQLISPLTASWLGHSLNTCAGVGLPSGCDLVGKMLVVDFNQVYLELSVVDFTHEAQAIEGTKLFKDVGASRLNTHDSNEDPDDKTQNPLITPSDVQVRRLEDTLRNFMAQNDLHPTGEVWSDLSAIILTGDASESTFNILEPLLQEMISNGFRHLLRKDIDPFYLGATGAGFQGRRQLLIPGFLDDIGGYVIPEHTEL